MRRPYAIALGIALALSTGTRIASAVPGHFSAPQLFPTSGSPGTAVHVEVTPNSCPSPNLLMLAVQGVSSATVFTNRGTTDGFDFAFPTQDVNGFALPSAMYALYGHCLATMAGPEIASYDPAFFTLNAGPADTTPPTWSVPSGVTADAGAADGIEVSFTATASDDVGVATSSCTTASGNWLPVGTTLVSCTARDLAGNYGYGSFRVVVTRGAGAPYVYTIQDLNPPGVYDAYVTALNASGVVALSTRTNAASGFSAFRGTPGAFQPLDSLPDSFSTFAGSINDAGDTGGTVDSTGVRWPAGSTTPIVLTAVGTAQPLTVKGINNSGVMVGEAFDNDANQASAYTASGATTTLLPSNGNQGEATGVDDTGRISGTVYSTPNRAARWVGGALTLFPDGTFTSLGQAIAPDGTVVVRQGSGMLGQLWHLDGTTTAIPLPTQANDLDPGAINAGHVVVGAARYAGSGYHAMLFDPGTGTSRNLNALVQPGSPWDLEGGVDVNDAGQVLAYGHAIDDPDLVRHALLLTPVADSVAPTITITSPADGAQYLQGQVVAPAYTCVDNLDPSPTCTPSSPTVDTATAGSRTFTVTSHDNVGNSASSSVSYTVLAGSGITSVSGSGGSFTTDTMRTGATADVPVQTAVVVPTGVTGTVSVTPSATLGVPPTGFGFFGTQLVINGPIASTGAPYTLTFTVDVTALAGVAPADLQVFHNGAAIADCTDPTAAVPNPCVVSRAATAGGDAVVTVRTATFSTWNVGRLAYKWRGFLQPVDDWPVVNTAKAGVSIPVRFSLTGNRGLKVFQAGSPSVTVASCPSTTTDAIEETTGGSASSLSYDAKTDVYTYTWKTDKTWSGCRVLTLRLRDGTSKKAAFSFTR